MKYDNIRRIAVLCLATSLAACDPPAPRNARLDLCAFIPPGAEAFHLRGEPGPELDNAILRLSEITRSKHSGEREHCGTRFSAKPGIDDDALAAQISAELGEDWHYRRDIASGHSAIRLHLWQTQSRFWPNRHYGLASYQTPLHDTHDQPFRPVYSVHITESSRGQHGAVVFAIVASSFLIPAVMLLLLWRMRRKRSQHSKKR